MALTSGLAAHQLLTELGVPPGDMHTRVAVAVSLVNALKLQVSELQKALEKAKGKASNTIHLSPVDGTIACAEVTWNPYRGSADPSRVTCAACRKTATFSILSQTLWSELAAASDSDLIAWVAAGGEEGRSMPTERDDFTRAQIFLVERQLFRLTRDGRMRRVYKDKTHTFFA
jgi:hypothetical protein